ncbi:MAG: glycosyltransferase family 2 protein [Verrucomicrobia bacterium]|nr:glycosyltransferase family 2 protein [Verrucomicrobiota bacterium]
MKKVAILILNWNGKSDTLACLSSLQAREPHEILVIDNGSTDGSVQEIRARFPHVTVIENGENLGFAEGNNVGIRVALSRGADFLFLLNNDTIVAPDLLEQLLATFETHPEAGIVGAHILLFEAKETLDHLGGKWNPKRGEFDFIGHRTPSGECVEPLELDYACGAGLMVRREVIEAIGMLDPRFFLIWEESDFCQRAKRAGFSVLTSPKAHLWHKVSASFKGKAHSTYYWWRNRFLYIEKNSPRSEKWRLFATVFLPELFHKCKIALLKRVQLKIERRLYPSQDLSQKESNLLKNRAALLGMRDYLCRRFGKGPF